MAKCLKNQEQAYIKTDALIDLLIKHVIESENIVNSKINDSLPPRWEGLQKINVLLEFHQKDFLDDLSKTIMRSRSPSEERITSNTIIRCLVNIFMENSGLMNYQQIKSEKDLKNRINYCFDLD